MAIYSTFFLCRSDQLQTGFPGWKLPLPQPITRTSINPFTRETMTITTRAPAWDDFDPENLDLPEFEVVAIEGDYASYLDERIPAFVRSQPHWCAKNLTSVELEPLVAAASGVDELVLSSALYAHPSLGAGMEQIPDDFVAKLRTSDDSVRDSLAHAWAARMSTPEYTHSVSGERLCDDWPVEFAMDILKSLVELARQQAEGQSMYLLLEA